MKELNECSIRERPRPAPRPSLYVTSPPVTRRSAQTKSRKKRKPVHEKATLPTLLWAGNLVLVMAAPVLFVYGTVLPLLDEAVPFLAHKCLSIYDITWLMQLLVVGWLLQRACEFYGAQMRLVTGRRQGVPGSSSKWCPECATEVALHASHCDVCDECVGSRQFQSVVLNACVARSDLHESHHQSLMMVWAGDTRAVIVFLFLEALLGSPLRFREIVLFSLLAFATGQHVQQEPEDRRDSSDLSPLQRVGTHQAWAKGQKASKSLSRRSRRASAGCRLRRESHSGGPPARPNRRGAGTPEQVSLSPLRKDVRGVPPPSRKPLWRPPNETQL